MERAHIPNKKRKQEESYQSSEEESYESSEEGSYESYEEKSYETSEEESDNDTQEEVLYPNVFQPLMLFPIKQILLQSTSDKEKKYTLCLIFREANKDMFDIITKIVKLDKNASLLGMKVEIGQDIDKKAMIEILKNLNKWAGLDSSHPFSSSIYKAFDLPKNNSQKEEASLAESFAQLRTNNQQPSTIVKVIKFNKEMYRDPLPPREEGLKADQQNNSTLNPK